MFRGGFAEQLMQLITSERTEHALWQHAMARQGKHVRM
jgi:hypothetical protein